VTTTKLLTQLSRVAAAAAVCLGAVGASQAMTLTSGNYKITFNNYDSGTLYSLPAAPGLMCGGITNSAANIAACDAIAVDLDGAGPLPPGALGGGGTYDTMGIFSVQSITNITTGDVEFSIGTASSIGGVQVGPYLTGIFGGLQDFGVAAIADPFGLPTGEIRTLSAGGYFTIFSNTADYDISIGPLGAGVNFQPGAQTYPTISPGIHDPDVFLSGVFVDGEALAGTDAGYVSTFNAATIAGNGSGFLNFTGGLALEFFDTGLVEGANGGMVDAQLTTTLVPATADVAAFGWTVTSTSDISGGLKVPEPGSLALVSLALLGMGGLARRKAKAGK
jgi:hypothetical protein